MNTATAPLPTTAGIGAVAHPCGLRPSYSLASSRRYEADLPTPCGPACRPYRRAWANPRRGKGPGKVDSCHQVHADAA